MSDLISRQAAIDAVWSLDVELRPSVIDAILNTLKDVPSAQLEPAWGLPVSTDRPLADREVVFRLRDIQKQVGGSYAIDRAIEVLENLPSAQPEIVRCEECINHGKEICYFWNTPSVLPPVCLSRS